MKNTRIVLLLLVTVLIISCNTRKDRSEDIQLIDQKMVEVNEAEEVFKNTDIATTKAHFKAIMDDIKFVQKNYTDTMPKDEAMFLTSYKNVAKLVKNLEEKEKKISLEIIRTRAQLANLKTAIISKATEDKSGQSIDDNYIDKAIKEEVLYVKQVVDQITYLKDNCDIVMDKYPKMKPQADKIITTLQLKMSGNE